MGSQLKDCQSNLGLDDNKVRAGPLSSHCRHGSPHSFFLCFRLLSSQLGRGIQEPDTGGRAITSTLDSSGEMQAVTGPDQPRAFPCLS